MSINFTVALTSRSELFMFRDSGDEREFTKCPASKLTYSILEYVLNGKSRFSCIAYKNTRIKVKRKNLKLT
jgi:hypothetical protein